MTFLIKPYADHVDLSVDGGNVALSIQSDGTVLLPATTSIDTATDRQLVTAQAVRDYVATNSIYQTYTRVTSASTPLYLPIPQYELAKRITVVFESLSRSTTSAIGITLTIDSNPYSDSGGSGSSTRMVGTAVSTSSGGISINANSGNSTLFSGRAVFDFSGRNSTNTGYDYVGSLLAGATLNSTATFLSAGLISPNTTGQRDIKANYVYISATAGTTITGDFTIMVEC